MSSADVVERQLHRFATLLLLGFLAGGCNPRLNDASPERSGKRSRIDGKRLLDNLRLLAADALGGRRVGTKGNAAAQAIIVTAFSNAGIEPFGTEYRQIFTTRSGRDTITGANVVGYVRGRDYANSWIVLSAHYDHIGVRGGEVYNGADDNASGTAALMALASYVAANPLRNGVVFAAFDAEELGLLGSRAFVADPPLPLDLVAANINMDMISRSDGVLFAAGTHHSPFLKECLAAVEEPGVVLRFGHDRPELGVGDWTRSSDHAPFHDAGIPFVYFGVEDHADYHRPTDDFERIDRSFYRAAVELILDAVLAVDDCLVHPGVGAAGRGPAH